MATIYVILTPKPDSQPLASARSIFSSTTGPEVRLGVLLMRLGLIGGTVAGAVIEHGFHTPSLPIWQIHVLQVILFTAYGVDFWLGPRLNRWGLRDVGPDWIDAVFIGLGVAGAALGAIVYESGWRLFELSAVLILITELWRLNVGLSRLFYRPGILLPLSFLTMIAVGTGLLMLPMAIPPGQTISWLDALFTMTSAVCVTGLIVRDTATQFTPFGQTVIGVFIQLGALGIVIFSSLTAMMLGIRLSLKEDLSLSSMLNDLPLNRITSFVRFIVLVTMLLELVGAALLIPMWHGDLSLTQRAGLSLFHAVSAFCNAGFSLQSDSLESYRYAPQVHLVIVPLIVIGGLGFSVLNVLWRGTWWHWGRRRGKARAVRPLSDEASQKIFRLDLHTKIVLSTTAALYLGGVLTLMAAQLKPHLDGYLQQGVTANQARPESLSVRGAAAMLADASFMSVTSRTAGFNTVPMDELTPASRLVSIILMMIGASPGGTGGGMKTTTLAVLLLAVAATVRQREHTEAFARRLSEQLIRRAATLAACFVALATGATLLLSFSEPYPFGKVAFEAVSAASTTGLSLGITGDLTAFGKVVIIATMFLGRIGPLALLGALLFRAKSTRPFAYPHEDVAMG